MTQTFTPLTTSFTPTCQNGLSTAGVSTMATAYDWFGATGTGGIAIAAVTPNENKYFATAIQQDARANLSIMVKAEFFMQQLSISESLITSSITSISSTLSSIQNAGFISQISTLTPSYTASLNTITSTLNRLKTLETRIYTPTDSYDQTSGQLTTAVSGTTTLTGFNGLKTYVSQFFDPAILGNSGTAIPAITSINGNVGNAATLATIFTAASSALSVSNIIANYEALVMSMGKQVFDAYCIAASGFASTDLSGTTGTPAGLYVGRDYQLSTVGEYQASTGAPATALILWGGDNAHTW